MLLALEVELLKSLLFANVKCYCPREWNFLRVSYMQMWHVITRTKRAALCSASKWLQNDCTADMQPKCSGLRASLQLMLSCSGLQKGFAAFRSTWHQCEVVLQLPRWLSCSCSKLLTDCTAQKFGENLCMNLWNSKLSLRVPVIFCADKRMA